MHQIKRLSKVLSISILSFLVTGCAGMFPLVGLDGNGNTIMERVNVEKYSDRLAEGLISVQESTIPALDEKTSGETVWKLRTAVIGVGVQVQGGIGPFQMSISPRIRAAFCNGKKAPIP